MKTTLFCILLLLSGIVSAQTIDHPPFKARSGSISNITRIERTPENTRVYIHAIFRPHWWIMEDGDTYLEDAATGKKYMFKSAEGIELKKEVYMPDSGTMDYVLVFAPLPSETQTIHFLNPTDPEGNIYDISLVPQKRKDSSPLATIKGNWFKTDGSGSWEYGVYDSISILNNRIYTNANIRKKGKRIEMTLKDRESQEEMTLSFTPQKDGTCKIQQKGAEELVYSKERTPITQVAAEPDFKQFFRQDSTYLQGYINGYDPRLGFDTGLIYLSNELTREDYPTVIQIAPNGSFSCRFIINHPIESSVVLGHNWIPFYIEPGQTLTMYIDWEAVMARSRARDHYFPIRNTAYMGPSASLSYLLKDFDNLITYRYEDLSKSQKTLTPDQYKEHMKPIIAQWKHIADSVRQIYQPSLKAVHLIKNKVDLQVGSTFLGFLMGRDYYAKQDSTNQALKVKENDSYYSFLKDMPLNDAVVLASKNASIFINRFEYMDIFRKAYPYQTFSTSDSIDYTYPKKSLLTFLKEKGVKLNKEQEAIRLKQEKLAGTTAKIIMRQLIAENEKMASLYEKEQKLIQEYVALYSEKKEESQQDDDSQSGKKLPQGSAGHGLGDGERASLMMPVFCLNMDSNVWPSGASPSVLIGLATGMFRDLAISARLLGLEEYSGNRALTPADLSLFSVEASWAELPSSSRLIPWMLMLRKPNSRQKWFMAACPVTRTRSFSGMSASSFLAQEESWSIFLFHRARPAL